VRTGHRPPHAARGARAPRGAAAGPPPMPPPPPLVALLPTPQRCVVHVARWRRHHSSTDIRRETGFFVYDEERCLKTAKRACMRHAVSYLAVSATLR
jgi:hypothetical protein